MVLAPAPARKWQSGTSFTQEDMAAGFSFRLSDGEIVSRTFVWRYCVVTLRLNVTEPVTGFVPPVVALTVTA